MTTRPYLVDKGYKYPAKTSTEVRPDQVKPKEVYGEHQSVVVAADVRQWYFETVEGRDAFLVGVNRGMFKERRRIVVHKPKGAGIP